MVLRFEDRTLLSRDTWFSSSSVKSQKCPSNYFGMHNNPSNMVCLVLVTWVEVYLDVDPLGWAGAGFMREIKGNSLHSSSLSFTLSAA